MDLTRLRHIAAVARNRSFSRAAEEEGITQPALSRSVAAFEQRHGVVLFDRGRGGVHPTAAGLLVIDQAKKLLAAAQDLERSLRRYPGGEAGRIAFGLGPLLASLFLPRLGASLLGTFPGIQVTTLIRPPTQLVTELLNDGIEMILGNNWNLGRVPGTELERLGRLKVAVMARGGHPLAQAGPVTAADLESYPAASAIELPTGGMSGTAGAFVCDNFHVLRETVLRTDCLWISSPAFLADDLREGRMVQLDVSDLAPTDSDICLVFKRGRTRSPAALAVADGVRTMLGEAIGT
jgi:DNA-binding transcriptional LysR family regulator